MWKSVLTFLILTSVQGTLSFNFLFGIPLQQSLRKATRSSFADDQCENQLKYFNQALSERKEWAIKSNFLVNVSTKSYQQIFFQVFDTWGKIQSGVLVGNRVNFGHFTECINFRYEAEPNGVGVIQGQHCLVAYAAIPESTLPDDSEGFDWREM